MSLVCRIVNVVAIISSCVTETGRLGRTGYRSRQWSSCAAFSKIVAIRVESTLANAPDPRASGGTLLAERQVDAQPLRKRIADPYLGGTNLAVACACPSVIDEAERLDPTKQGHLDVRASGGVQQKPFVATTHGMSWPSGSGTRRSGIGYVVAENGEEHEAERTVTRHKTSPSALDLVDASGLWAADGDRTAGAIGSQIRVFVCGLRRLSPDDVPPAQGRRAGSRQVVR